MDSMDTSAIPKKRGGKRTKMPKIEPEVEVWKEYGCTYWTEHLNFSRVEHDSESDSDLILAQAIKDQMGTKNKSRIITSYEYNVLSNILYTSKRATTKNSHYSPILQGCMSARSGRAKLRNLRILLGRCISSTVIIMVELTSKLKQNVRTITTWENQAGKFTTSKKVNV